MTGVPSLYTTASSLLKQPDKQKRTSRLERMDYCASLSRSFRCMKRIPALLEQRRDRWSSPPRRELTNRPNQTMRRMGHDRCSFHRPPTSPLTQDKRRVGDLISEALPFGRLWYKGTKAIGQAIGYAKFWSRSHDAIFNKSQRVVRNPFFPSQAPSHPIYPSPSPRPHTRQQFRPPLAQGAFEREGVDKPDTQ